MYVNKEEFEYIKTLGIRYEWQEVSGSVIKMTIWEFMKLNDEVVEEFNEMFQYNISHKCTHYEEYDININNNKI